MTQSIEESVPCSENKSSNPNGSRRKRGFSKIGFVLATAGAAVGLGNIWRFPIQVQKYGGGAFVIMCLIFATLLGSVLLMLEIAIGRKTGQGVIGAFRTLCKKFWWLGILAALVPLLVLSYYNVIGGWALFYAVYYITYGMGQGFASFDPTTPSGASNVYNGLLKGANGYVGIIFTLIFLAAIVIVVLMGIQKGIEKVSKVVMPVLAVFILFVVIYTLCQGKDAWIGVKNFFVPNFKEFFGLDKGSFKMDGVLAAITQVFYSLSIGSASIITYGSYMQKKESIPTATTQIIVFDTAICILAGLIIIPGLFILGGGQVFLNAEGLIPAGSELLFVQVPQLFFKTGGQVGSLIFGSLFFILVFFAAFTPAISQLEAVVDAAMELFKLTRKKAVIIFSVFFAIMAILISFGHAFNWRVLPTVSTDSPTGWTQMTLDDSIDFVASTLIVCIVAFLTCVCAAWCSDFKQIQNEIGYKKKWSRSFYQVMIKFVAPILILIILVWGVLSTFIAF